MLMIDIFGLNPWGFAAVLIPALIAWIYVKFFKKSKKKPIKRAYVAPPERSVMSKLEELIQAIRPNQDDGKAFYMSEDLHIELKLYYEAQPYYKKDAPMQYMGIRIILSKSQEWDTIVYR